MTVIAVDSKVVDVLSRKILVVGKRGKLQLAETIYFLYVMADIHQKF